jgi:hypothetical protein
VNPEIKARWVTALRSGRYRQGAGSLKTTIRGKVSHCCLGVLCELAREDGVVVEKVTGPRSYFGSDAEQSASVLPRAVQAWAGLPYDPAVKSPLGVSMKLSQLNDSGTSFYRIAGYVERQL